MGVVASNNFLLSCADTFGEIYRVYLEDKKEDARPADWVRRASDAFHMS